MKKKSNKTIAQALSISVLSMLLSVSMFVGTTFAWFSDSVNSSNNRIMAGNLSIDLELLEDGQYSSIRGTNKSLFNNYLWEPGYVQAVNVRVVNRGTLSLKYELEIDADGILESLLANEIMLSDVIDVYYADKEVLVNGNDGLTQAVAEGRLVHVGTLTQVLLAGTLIKDFLLPEGANEDRDYSVDYATIVLKMKEQAGNDYQDLSVGESFDLRLIATQYSYEKDSFDEKYDLQMQRGLIFDDGKEHNVSETVTLGKESNSTDVITAIGAGTVVNIRGGYYDVGSKDCAVWAKDGAVVNIYDGAFFCDGLGEEATPDNHQDLIYAGANGGTINIYGGLFSAREAGAWLLNERDGHGTINVYGGTFVDWNPIDNISEGVGTNFLQADSCLLVSQKGDSTYYSVLPADNAIKDNGNSHDMEILGNVTMVGVPLICELDATEAYTINGNGHTVTGVMFQQEDFPLDPTECVPLNCWTFSSANGAKATVNDLTITGTVHNVQAGDYRPDTRKKTVTEFNNVNIINCETFLMSGQWYTSLYACGTITMNNCNVYGTKKSPLDLYAEYGKDRPIYDMLCCSFSTTTINGGKYGSIMTGHTTKLYVYGAEIDKIVASNPGTNWYIEEGSVVGVLDLSIVSKNYRNRIKIADTATVGKIIDDGIEYATFEDWYNSF